MKFKIDENLPDEVVDLLQESGYDAYSARAQGLEGSRDQDLYAVCLREARVLVSLDRDFGDIRRYPPGEHHGVIVLAPPIQTKTAITALVRQAIALLVAEDVHQSLWIAEADRVRIRRDRTD